MERYEQTARIGTISMRDAAPAVEQPEMSATQKAAALVDRMSYALERLDNLRAALGAPSVAELNKAPVPEPMPRLLVSLDKSMSLGERIHDALTYIEARL